jgi:cyclophilin family peptidyl-prolyl cis-trans isomerase
MAQGGGTTTATRKKPVNDPVQNEADNGLKNVRGTVAMARTNDPHSATSQFFVNVADNAFLDHKGKTQSEWGYTVFGTVTTGMDCDRQDRGTTDRRPGALRQGRPARAGGDPRRKASASFRRLRHSGQSGRFAIFG